MEEAYHGGQKEITLNDVPDRSRRLIVNLPAGLTAGQHLRLRARAPRTATGVAGDLYLTVELAPHHRFRLLRRDLYIDLPITPWEAALGAEVTAATLDGETTLRIPAGSQGGQYLRLKERGWPGSRRGINMSGWRSVRRRPKPPATRPCIGVWPSRCLSIPAPIPTQQSGGRCRLSGHKALRRLRHKSRSRPSRRRQRPLDLVP